MLNSIGNLFIIIRCGGSFFLFVLLLTRSLRVTALRKKEKKHTPALKYTRGWQRDMGNWPKGEMEVMRRALCWEKKKKQTKREEKQRTMWKILTVPVPDRADRAWPYPGRHSVALFFLLRALWVFCYFYACYLFSPLLPRFLINAESANQVFYNLTLGQIRFTGKRWWHSWRSINLNYRQHQITSTGEGSTEKRLVLLPISALDVHRTRLRLIRTSGPGAFTRDSYFTSN